MLLFPQMSFCRNAAWVVWFFQLILISSANPGTVSGCDGYPCSIGTTQTQPIRSQMEAELLSRCHAACLEKYAVEPEILTNAHASNVLWPSVSLQDLNDRRGCETIAELVTCRKGCSIRNSNSSFSRSSCRKKYNSDCPTYCPGSRCTISDFPQCQMSCNVKDGSIEGCAINLLKVTTKKEYAQPKNPVSGLNLTKKLEPLPQGPGKFNLGLYPVPRSSQLNTALPLTAFLIRVERDLQSYYYIKDTITSGILDLSYFGCTTTNISFAVANRYNLSDFSIPTPTCIHGATRYPMLKSNGLSYSVMLDTRETFEHNVAITVAWKKPTEFHLVKHYKIVINTSNSSCAAPKTINEQYHNISGSLTNFMIYARSTLQLPKANCIYHCSLEVFPRNKPSSLNITINTALQTFIPQIRLNCTYSINENTGVAWAEAAWNIEETQDTQIIVNSIANYTLAYEDSWTEGKNLTMPFTSYNDTTKIYMYNRSNIHPTSDKEEWIKFTVTPHRNTNSRFNYLPDIRTCTLHLPPPAPSSITVSSIVVLHFSIFLGKIRLRMTWNSPEKTYGKIMNYQIRLLLHQAYSDDPVTSEMQITITSPEMNLQPGQLIEEETDISDEYVCLYAQVRARNDYLWGEWSDTVPLVRYPKTNPNCTAPLRSKTTLPHTAVLSLGVGTGLLVALILCFILLNLIICLCKRHRMKVQMRRAFDNGYANPMFLARGGQRVNNENTFRAPLELFQEQEMDEWEIPVSSVIVESKFGEGCFGEVHKGIVRGPLPSTRSMKTNICVAVAIKMLKSTATGSERTDFIHEIETMKKVAQGNNPHVITFIGCATLQEPLCLITEFVKYGDLLSYLEAIRKMVTHKNRQRRMAKIIADMSKEPEPYLIPKLQQQHGDKLLVSAAAAAAPKSTEFGKDIMGDQVLPKPGSRYAELGGVEPINLISFAYQIASGMEYLTSIDIVHRDLACRNILIGEDKSLKISDFGMSRVVEGEDIYVKTSRGRLPWKWMAIESIVNREFTHASDVWAYGVTLWEIATLGGFPYPTISNADLLDYLKKGYRLECPENCSPEIYEVMTDCWCDMPGDRKTFRELRSLFDAMLAEDNPYIQFENINAHKPYYNVSSRRNTTCEGEELVTNFGSSEIAFEASSESNTTVNGASATGGAYDNLIPLLPPRTPSSSLEEQQDYHLHIFTNQYVDTPTTFEYLADLENSTEEEVLSIGRSPSCEADVSGLRKEKTRVSTEIPMEMNSAATSTHLVE